MEAISPPSLAEIKSAWQELQAWVRHTPVWTWQSQVKDQLLGPETQVHFKLELLQYGGSFKPRGAFMVMLSLSPDQLSKGVTAVSAGNHAIAVSYAARQLGTEAKVVMPGNANPSRVARCRALGAEVVLAQNVSEAFVEVNRIQEEEGRHFIHPFEGPLTTLGTASLGYEYARQVPHLDVAIIPIGGGGLAAGMATAIRYQFPDCTLIGVEPEGADSMHRSFRSGQPEKIDKVRTIADSLGAPFALPQSFALCRQQLDELVLVDDPMLRSTMRLMFDELKLAVEPAGAASLAALLGPLRDRFQGKEIGLIVCGANIDIGTYYHLVHQAADW